MNKIRKVSGKKIFQNGENSSVSKADKYECVFARLSMSVADFSSTLLSWEINTNVINIAKQSGIYFPSSAINLTSYYVSLTCYLIQFCLL